MLAWAGALAAGVVAERWIKRDGARAPAPTDTLGNLLVDAAPIGIALIVFKLMRE